jgi:hypothetical protein
VRVAHIDQAPSSHRQSQPKNVRFSTSCGGHYWPVVPLPADSAKTYGDSVHETAYRKTDAFLVPVAPPGRTSSALITNRNWEQSGRTSDRQRLGSLRHRPQAAERYLWSSTRRGRLPRPRGAPVRARRHQSHPCLLHDLGPSQHRRGEHCGQWCLVHNVLTAFDRSRSLKHVALVTGLKHYLGPFECTPRSSWTLRSARRCRGCPP